MRIWVAGVKTVFDKEDHGELIVLHESRGGHASPMHARMLGGVEQDVVVGEHASR
jgi:hypothetical protein